MPVKVKCPSCDHELAAPEEMVGQAVACPLCNSQFVISGNSTAPALNPMPPVSGPPGGGVSSAEPPVQSSPPSNPGTAKFKGAPQNPAEPPPSGGAMSPPSTPPKQKTQPPKKKQPKKRAGQAKFVSASATQTDLRLGDDGKLPELAIADTIERESAAEATSQSNPILLITVFAVSVGLSLALLFLDSSSVKSESESKQEAREEVINRYFGDANSAALKDYQLVLRKAIAFHDKGNYREERRHYRRVMDMLVEERENDLSGLTGLPSHDVMPNDEDLKRQLDTLLKQ